MKKLLAGLALVTLMTATAPAFAQPWHHHTVCGWFHHHRSCHWVR